MTTAEMKDKIVEDRGIALSSALIERKLTLPDVDRMASVLVGARKVGKSSVLRLHAQSLVRQGVEEDRIVYLSFLGYDKETVPFSIIPEAYYSLYPHNIEKTVYFLIDEIQATQGWGPQIADLMDRRKCRVVVTGSNAKLLSVDIATELRGFCLPQRFHPLSFGEFLSFRKIHTTTDAAYTDKERYTLINAYEDYLEKGSYPLLANIEDAGLRTEILLSYLDVTYSRDLIDRYEPEKAVVLKKIFDRQVRSSGQPYTINKIVHAIKSQGFKGITNELVASFLDMLVDSCFFVDVPILGNENRINANARKMYTIDPAMATLLSSFTTSRGVRLEHAIMMVLLRISPYISYHRTKDNYEIDFVVTDRFKTPLALVQVTDDWSVSRERELRAMRAAMAELDMKEGYMVTMNDEEEITVDEGLVHVIPAWRFSLNPPLGIRRS